MAIYKMPYTGDQIKQAIKDVIDGAFSKAKHEHSAGDITSGILPASRGGTGETSAKDAMKLYINSLDTEASNPQDDDYFIAQASGGGTTNIVYYRKKLSVLWNYIKGKADTVYAKASHNHSADNITSGTLPAERGGTGNATLKDSMNALVNSLGTGTDAPTDDDYFISQYVGGGDTTTTYHRRKLSKLWAYIKSKADSVYEPSITTLPISKGGTGETNRLESLSLSSVKGNGSYGLRYYPYLKMCFLRMQVKGFAVEQGKTTTVGVVPSGYRPSYINALSVYYSGYGTIVKAQVNSSGEIRILSSAAIGTSANVYITGWWIAS